MTTSRLEKVQTVVDVLAKISAVCIAIFGVWQFQHGQTLERQQVAIESVARLRTKEVVEGLVRLDDHYNRGDLNYEGMTFDVAHVVGWYDYVAMLYVTGAIIDRCIVKGVVEQNVDLIQNVMNESKYPARRRVYFDLLANRMSGEPCEFVPARKPETR